MINLFNWWCTWKQQFMTRIHCGNLPNLGFWTHLFGIFCPSVTSMRLFENASLILYYFIIVTFSACMKAWSHINIIKITNLCQNSKLINKHASFSNVFCYILYSSTGWWLLVCYHIFLFNFLGICMVLSLTLSII